MSWKHLKRMDCLYFHANVLIPKKESLQSYFHTVVLSKFVNIVFPCEIMAVILTADMFLSVLIFNSALLLNT